MTNSQGNTQADERPLIVSVERTLIILDLIARSPDGIGTREIS
jgi:hypothetical protein